MAQATLPELQTAYEQAAAAWGRAMHDVTVGKVSQREVGTLKRRMNRAEVDLRAARYEVA